MKRVLIAAALVSSTIAGLVTGSTAPSVRSMGSSVEEGCAALPPARGADGLASGRGLWAVAGGRLVSVGEGRAVSRDDIVALASQGEDGAIAHGSIRHVATRGAVGTAFVLDRAGADALVTITSSGVEVLPQAGEVSHPTWSPRGRLAWSTGAAIVVREPATGRILELPAPRRDASVFEPIFLTEQRIAAVVAVPTAEGVFEGERLGNLWATDMSGGGWTALTHFRARGDRWSTIRTPVAHTGGIDFVRISARGSSTGGPAFQLWRYQDGSARLVDRMEDERYLAGWFGGRLVWNRPDPVHARDLLEVEDEGRMRTIGCGAVLVDPADVPDPDRRAGSSLTPARADEQGSVAVAEAAAEEIAVIVGDYPDEAEAAAAASLMRSTYPASLVEVVAHADAPSAIRPGAFGALLHLQPTADPTLALARFRNALPRFASNSWIVTP